MFKATTDNTGQPNKKNLSLLKFTVILIVLTLLNRNMITKLPHYPPTLRKRGLN